MAKYSREFFLAMCSFLQSEKTRHAEDIAMIDEKLEALRLAGYVCEDEAPWIESEDIEPQATTYWDIQDDLEYKEEY